MKIQALLVGVDRWILTDVSEDRSAFILRAKETK
jgi:hypothetical protein